MKRVLVIDDARTIHDCFRLALERLGYDVRCASTGPEGLLMAQSTQPDLVFLDLKLPEVDGVDTLVQLRASGFDAPVFLISGFVDEFMARLQDIKHLGLDFELMHKPLDIDQIATVVNILLGENEFGEEERPACGAS